MSARSDGGLPFHAAEPPSDEDVARLLATIYRRVRRLLVRRGLDADDVAELDPLAEESPALAGISTASVQGRIALGPRAGARVLQLGRDPDASWVTSRGPCQAHLEGFDLHANITVEANDRPGLERLCCYVLRPPVAQDRSLPLVEDQMARRIEIGHAVMRPGEVGRDGIPWPCEDGHKEHVPQSPLVQDGDRIVELLVRAVSRPDELSGLAETVIGMGRLGV